MSGISLLKAFVKLVFQYFLLLGQVIMHAIGVYRKERDSGATRQQKFMKYLGAAMISFSLAALVYSYTPILQRDYLGEELTYASTETPVPVVYWEQHEPSPPAPPSRAVELGLDPEFSLYIPKINVKSNVIPEVDAGDKNEYLPAILKGVGHAKGTSYPGNPGVTYLFAHSTNSPAYIEEFNAVFYDLRKMEVGDEVNVFYKGGEFVYRVIDKKIVAVDDVSYITSTDPTERLILQTSYPPGTTWKRLLLICERI